MAEIPANTQIGADGVRYPTGQSAPPEFSSEDVTIGTTLSAVHTATARARFPGETVTIQVQTSGAIVTVGDDNIGNGTNGVVLATQYDSVTIPLRREGEVVYAISDTPSTVVSVTRA